MWGLKGLKVLDGAGWEENAVKFVILLWSVEGLTQCTPTPQRAIHFYILTTPLGGDGDVHHVGVMVGFTMWG